MSNQQCVGPLGRRVGEQPSGCPTTPKYRLQLDETETWACERHLAPAVKAFETPVPIAVTRAA
jgi:hypothetical protein